MQSSEKHSAELSGAGRKLHNFIRKLFPIRRSLTGDGTRETLKLIQEVLPDLEIHEVAAGQDVFDWTVPPEWNITEGWLEDPSGSRVTPASTAG